MGCLFEFLFEVIGEAILELLLEGYLRLMSLIVPSSGIPETQRSKFKRIVKVFSIVLLFSLFIGLLMLIIPGTPVTIHSIGKYLLYISFALIGMQILFGIVLKVAEAVRKKK
jgi:hypothetical protein